MINTYISALAQYAVDRGLIEENERIYSINMLLDVLKLDEYNPCDDEDKVIALSSDLEAILQFIDDYACDRGLIEENSVVYRDLFDTRVMNCFVRRPSEVIRIFNEKYAVSPKEATDFYYEYSKNSDYIRTYRIAKDIKWVYESEYGDIDITINMSKPEKDPKAIAAARNAKQSSYPKCLLCVENEGYAGRINHPARENHRIIPIRILGKEWGFQYSPYVYYNEHCIVLNREHTPMTINREVFEKLFDFIRQFPHYVIATNADLPIVGGSILSHEHFQGGNYSFAMSRAVIEKEVVFKGFEDVEAGILKWPMSVIRIRSTSQERLVDLADKILGAWREYTDEEAFIFAKTNGEPHNTITPAARFANGKYELDLALRNNITTEERPLGVYHPRNEYHHIKKENIGGIEVMGLAILPSRIKSEMELLARCIIEGKDIRSFDELLKHADWAEEFIPKYEGKINKENVDEILKAEIGKVFVKVLEDAGVFKRDKKGREYFMKFIESV
ncbi:MAG: UDP-glucose--hexose-1-phosphate uridylyltransferase [Lachnospiraceae bacterium]|nr:UDP-glucose--hexose-1-phosphate uridylyltransferase [Lachnospiraceae bacterium]MCI6408628.1 UDP-glucose--hexose-1-phosphate uridylyltransferase [Lachnospiraceae bacterium]MDO4509467.1 UDP-glucose--hexose-1-phosphate uridylyltransferase [Lachnospiraceae bacterium]MDY4428236.1 UDP-glucose--hexose-1-phosphate uridylyltransferase [Lachnospiraceae bacterium]MDY4836919.1 UDP-glucose--hexose-1-phosphate uridylyltransferase [Lachnospiraceae bacterium]